MTPSVVFSIANMSVIPMWALMIFLPNWKTTRILIDFKVLPILLSLFYVVYIIRTIQIGANMDFGSLDSVMALFTEENAVLAGWIHYLVFDMVVGMWILDKNREIGISHLLIAPCLIGSFMFGPVGFLMFMVMAMPRSKRKISL